MRITIDPGHTKNVNAGVTKGYYEGNAMFVLANYLADALSQYKDTEVLLTRGEDENPTVSERGSLAANSGSRVFISLHSNATSESEDAAYVCGFYSVKRTVSKELCQKLISAVTDVMKKSTDAWNRGALTKKTSSGNDYYGVIRNSVAGNSPVEYSLLIEHGFHTNIKECEFLSDSENLKKIAEAEAEVLAEYFEMEKKVNFVVTREEIPSGADLNDYVYQGEYYFAGYMNKVKNATPSESENSAFILDVTTCSYDDVPYCLQRVYYITSGKEYVRGIYIKDGKFDEVHKEWSKI